MNNTHISNNSNDKKIRFFAQEFTKNQYRAGDCLKLGGGRGRGGGGDWKVCILKVGDLARKIGS